MKSGIDNDSNTFSHLEPWLQIEWSNFLKRIVRAATKPRWSKIEAMNFKKNLLSDFFFLSKIFENVSYQVCECP